MHTSHSTGLWREAGLRCAVLLLSTFLVGKPRDSSTPQPNFWLPRWVHHFDTSLRKGQLNPWWRNWNAFFLALYLLVFTLMLQPWNKTRLQLWNILFRIKKTRKKEKGKRVNELGTTNFGESFRETRWSAYGLSRGLRYRLELSSTHLLNWVR